MRSSLLQLGALVLVCNMLASCGNSDGVAQEPAASAKPTDEPVDKSTDKPAEKAAEKPAEKSADKKTADKKSQDNPPTGETKLEQQAHETIATFKKTDPDMKEFFDDSKGYAVFPVFGPLRPQDRAPTPKRVTRSCR